MKNSKSIKCLITSLVIILCFSGCSSDYSNVKNITVTIDPNKRESKYKVINITNKDSIRTFMEKLDNRVKEPAIFLAKFSIDIYYLDNKYEGFYGNGNYVKSDKGPTYRLLEKEWNIYNY